MRTQPRETFGEALRRLLGGVPLARLAQAADVDYSHLHTLAKGVRARKRVRPSVDLIVRLIPALRSLGRDVKEEDESALLETAADLPEGYRIVAERSAAEYLDAGRLPRAAWSEPLTESMRRFLGYSEEEQESIAYLIIDAERRAWEKRERERLARERDDHPNGKATNGV